MGTEGSQSEPDRFSHPTRVLSVSADAVQDQSIALNCGERMCDPAKNREEEKLETMASSLMPVSQDKAPRDDLKESNDEELWFSCDDEDSNQEQEKTAGGKKKEAELRVMTPEEVDSLFIYDYAPNHLNTAEAWCFKALTKKLRREMMAKFVYTFDATEDDEESEEEEYILDPEYLEQHSRRDQGNLPGACCPSKASAGPGRAVEARRGLRKILACNPSVLKLSRVSLKLSW